MELNRIRRTIDLSKDISRDTIKTLFVTGDNLAHTFVLTVLDGGKPADLSSIEKVRWYFLKLNENEAGTVFGDGEVTDNKITFTLSQACYSVEGPFALSLKLIEGEKTATLYYGTGYVRASQSGEMTGEGVVITLEELEQRIKAMDRAYKWANTTVETQTLEPEESAYVEVIEQNDGLLLNYGIPRGAAGATYTLYHFTAYAGNWVAVENGSQYVKQDIPIEGMQDVHGDLRLDTSQMDPSVVSKYMSVFNNIWRATTYEGGIRLEALGAIGIHIPLVVGVYRWAP